MATPKLDPTALEQFIEAGHSQAEAAAHFGVSEAAISQPAARRCHFRGRVRSNNQESPKAEAEVRISNWRAV